MEMLYHVDESDLVLGSVERERAHREGILHRTGIVFVVRSDEKILLQRRSAEKRTFPNRYDTSASFHVKFGESYEEAAKRELKEETGLSAPLEYLGKFTHRDPPEYQIVAVFLCRSDEDIQIDSSEAIGADFHQKEQIDEIVASKPVTPWLRDGWKLAKDRI
jgi:isopentenyl-diphosphate delta-isomerase